MPVFALICSTKYYESWHLYVVKHCGTSSRDQYQVTPVSKTGMDFFCSHSCKVFSEGVWITANPQRGFSQNGGHRSTRGVFGCQWSRRPFSKHDRTFLGIPPFWQRESLKEVEGWGEGQAEDGQRLPHRAWSSDCEKILFFTLPSEEPSDRRGILSLSPLGLEEAAEGYFPRS